MKFIASGIVGFIALVALTALLDLLSEEIRGQLNRIPFTLLWLARQRVPKELQISLHDEEWMPELHHILHREEARPISRLILGSWFALGLLRTAGRISRARGGSASTEIDGDELLAIKTVAPVQSILSEEQEEANLLAQMAAGDAGAPLTELYQRYARRLFRFGVQALGDDGLAEEMVQECFMRLWRTAGRFDPSRVTVGTYLFVMARSVAMDIRKRPSSRSLAAPPDEIELADAGEWVDTDTEERITQRLSVREAIETLPLSQRDMIILAYYEDLTQAQIANRLSIPLATVGARMSKAQRALRDALTARGITR